MISYQSSDSPEPSQLFLEEQVVRLQALLEASRQVHSTIDLDQVLHRVARIVVLELEMKGAVFTRPRVGFGEYPQDSDLLACPGCVRLPLLARDGSSLSELLVFPQRDRELTLFEADFLEGLLLQTAIATENAANHKRHLEYARLAQDLDAARAIQRSLLPQAMPEIDSYSVAARSQACYQVGGDYLDIVAEPGGSHLMVIGDVAGKGLASALVCTAFRSAFRALARECLPLDELAARLSQQHWEEGSEARRRYVTALFIRLHPTHSRIEAVNAGHNPACLLRAAGPETQMIAASGTPLGMLPNSRYATEHLFLRAGDRLLLYTDGLTEVFRGEEEFGLERLIDVFRSGWLAGSGAEEHLDAIWTELQDFSDQAPQQDDMSAIALVHLYPSPQEIS